MRPILECQEGATLLQVGREDVFCFCFNVIMTAVNSCVDRVPGLIYLSLLETAALSFHDLPPTFHHAKSDHNLS